jgi:sensor domain CHASE-containing protein
MDFELGAWGDGTIRLVFWDSAAGNDIVFVLDSDGQAYRASYVGDDTEARTPVQLVLALRELAQKKKDTGETNA